MININLTDEEFVQGNHCLELEIPWMTEGAINKLDEILNENDTVLEYGSGGSTLFFARRCKKVLSYDTSLDWHALVQKEIENRNIENVWSYYIAQEDALCPPFKKGDMDVFTVLSVDTQGGINRSKILNHFIKNNREPNLRILILDNYGHEGLFPDHWDKDNFMGDDWEVFTCNHHRWAGFGTRIYIKK
jgi:hypothetical protein